MKSKENQVLGLFFNNPTREWHFEEILKETKIARSKADRWLKNFLKEGIIKKIKEKGKMPYYISRHQYPAYRNKKKIFALSLLYQSGLLNHLGMLEAAKTIIIFGSFARNDWYKDSDIDIFIYGDPKGLKIAKYEMKLHRDIQLFICQDKENLDKLGKGLLDNIIKGNVIKDNIGLVKVEMNA